MSLRDGDPADIGSGSRTSCRSCSASRCWSLRGSRRSRARFDASRPTRGDWATVRTVEAPSPRRWPVSFTPGLRSRRDRQRRGRWRRAQVATMLLETRVRARSARCFVRRRRRPRRRRGQLRHGGERGASIHPTFRRARVPRGTAASSSRSVATRRGPRGSRRARADPPVGAPSRSRTCGSRASRRTPRRRCGPPGGGGDRGSTTFERSPSMQRVARGRVGPWQVPAIRRRMAATNHRRINRRPGRSMDAPSDRRANRSAADDCPGPRRPGSRIARPVHQHSAPSFVLVRPVHDGRRQDRPT